MTWQGHNSLDDDGDGLPNVLDRGVGAKLFRIYAGDGLPAGFAERDAPLLAWLDRRHHRYDVTTDVALAGNSRPRLEDYRGVILPSDVRWLPRSLLQRLRRYVRDGGKRRHLRRRLAAAPGHPHRVAGGWSTRPPRRPPTSSACACARSRDCRKPTNLVTANDDIDFFAGTAGAFGPFSLVQESELTEDEAEASAVTEDPQTGRAVIAAQREGKGLVLRFRVPELPSHLSARANDPNTTALLDRTWTLLSR